MSKSSAEPARGTREHEAAPLRAGAPAEGLPPGAGVLAAAESSAWCADSRLRRGSPAQHRRAGSQLKAQRYRWLRTAFFLLYSAELYCVALRGWGQDPSFCDPSAPKAFQKGDQWKSFRVLRNFCETTFLIFWSVHISLQENPAVTKVRMQGKQPPSGLIVLFSTRQSSLPWLFLLCLIYSEHAHRFG
ncbi:uncharacterized protein LOC110393577 isoform X2 [Numida meleagris]|nr:uncharacterized protein LOC110393577 isoform X2 [Numida meleagris]